MTPPDRERPNSERARASASVPEVWRHEASDPRLSKRLIRVPPVRARAVRKRLARGPERPS